MSLSPFFWFPTRVGIHKSETFILSLLCGEFQTVIIHPLWIAGFCQVTVTILWRFERVTKWFEALFLFPPKSFVETVFESACEVNFKGASLKIMLSWRVALMLNNFLILDIKSLVVTTPGRLNKMLSFLLPWNISYCWNGDHQNKKNIFFAA